MSRKRIFAGAAFRKGAHSALLCVIAGGLSVSPAWAESSTQPYLSIPFAKPADAIESLRDAYNSVQMANSIRALLGNREHALSLTQKVTSPELETTKFQAYFRGLEVIGSMALYHRGMNGIEVSDDVARFDLDTEPTVSPMEAVAIARSLAEGRTLESQPELKILPTEDEQSARLIYWVGLRGNSRLPGADVLINAHSGDVIGNIERHMPIAPINVRQASSACQSIDMASGSPIHVQISKCKQTVRNGVVSSSADTSARRAAANSKKVLEYYLDHHGRDSYDDKGSASVSIVHVGRNFDNAYWSSETNTMSYGDGDGQELGDFTRALDVAGHEMTHGVVSQTAKLMYLGESGALNEAYSDFFGMMIQGSEDWILGRDLFLDPSKAEGFRNLANPHALSVNYVDDLGKKQRKPYPASMDEMFISKSTCSRLNDNCYVHINSTIPSHASYLIVKAIGAAKAEKLYYRTLTHKLRATTGFRSASKATQQVCKQLYDSATCSKVKAAFAKVGL